ncbi:MAG TPA: choice-of-anchor B family protein [Bacteroidia bacterium]|nr:choice-of-anchor B family protein [Bacteroidia bacterium]
MKKILFTFAFITSVMVSVAQLNMTLKSNFSYGATTLASLWGWADGNGNEYALVGANNGLSIVDVTNPFSPVQVQFIATQVSNWHEIKTWQHYAYCTNETGGGTLIVDLGGTPGSFNYFYDTQGTYNGTNYSITDAHTVTIDENGYMWLQGGQCPTGAWCFNLNTNPMNPTLVAHYNAYGSHFIHDSYVRNNIMYAASTYSGLFEIFNVTVKNNPVLLATQSTPWTYCHNTWLSDNSQTLFVTDEVLGAYVTAYDISDLSNIAEIDRFTANPGTQSQPHNVHVLNDYLVMSHYRDGVCVADAHRPSNIIKIGEYDTYAQGTGGGIQGCWGVYPYLPSGNILASDITNGLFVLGTTYSRASYLEGTVTDSVTGMPLNGVSVTILSAPGAQSANTAITGAYATGSATPGTYSVEFSKPGYVTRTFQAVITPGNVTILNTVLGAAPGCAAPTVLNAINITGTTATLTWNNVNAISYLVTWRKQQGGSASSATTTATSYNISGLQSCKAYKFQVEATCLGGAKYTSVWKNFSTTGSNCKPPGENPDMSAYTEDMLVPVFYPNPFTNKIKFDLLLEEGSYVQVDLMDMTGKLVTHLLQHSMLKGDNTVQIETTNLLPGIYIAKTTAGEKNYYTRLVKQ